MRVRLASGIALIAVAITAAGCTKTLDKQGLEDQIASALQSNGPALTVRCPDGVKAQAGAVFECTASDPSGSSIAITVTQTDDKGNVTWTFSNPGTPSPSVSPSGSLGPSVSSTASSSPTT